MLSSPIVGGLAKIYQRVVLSPFIGRIVKYKSEAPNTPVSFFPGKFIINIKAPPS
jgi:hypothetical protein